MGSSAHAATAPALPVELKRATNPWARFIGLMGKKNLDPGEALYIAPCASIHTLFMRFPIDVAFVDRAGRVVKTAEAVGPWRMMLGGKGAHGVVELAAGGLRRHGLEPGSLLPLT